MTVTGSVFNANTGSTTIWNDARSMAVNDSTFTNNIAPASLIEWGGCIYNDGKTLTVANSTFTSNSAYNGGAIANASGGVLTVSGSTFADNSTTDDGSAIINSASTLIIVNSTFADNVTVYINGAVENCNGGTMLVTNSTFAGNVGGGIRNDASSLTLNNTIVAGNVSSANTGNTDSDIAGTIQSASNDLIGDGAGITNLAQLSNSNLIGTTVDPIDPMLGPLQNNGGPTETMALLTAPWVSPAIDAGNNALAVDANSNPLTTDQRGLPRVFNGVGTDREISASFEQEKSATEVGQPTPVG